MTRLRFAAEVEDEDHRESSPVDVDHAVPRTDRALVPGAALPIERGDKFVLAEADVSDQHEGSQCPVGACSCDADQRRTISI